MFNKENYATLRKELDARQVTLVAVSKFKSVAHIRQAYDEGQRDFGENYVQELITKKDQLPEDIRWHFIGNLQRNKVKYIAPFIYLIQGVDSEKLLKEINKQAEKFNRKINCLLQVHIAREDTKFGFSLEELSAVQPEQYPYVQVCGLMGMASFTDDKNIVKAEMERLKTAFDHYREQYGFTILSMGMTNDYATAIEAGSNMVRIGSLIFGNR